MWYCSSIGQSLIQKVWTMLPNGLKDSLINSTPSIQQRLKLDDIGFGDYTNISEDGVNTFYVLRINEYSFVWGNSEDFSEEGLERIHEKLEECVAIVRGAI